MGGKKAGGGFLGVGGESGFLNTGLFSSGPQKVKGFEMSPALQKYENDMLLHQNAISNGQAPSIARMAIRKNIEHANNAALAMAASQRGSSNPALAFRQAQIMGQEAQLQGAQEGAMMVEAEKRQADQMIAAQAAAHRGVALNQETTNLNAKMQGQQNNLNAIVGIGNTAAKAATGGGKPPGAAHGAIVPGEPIVEGDHPVNDTVPYMLSPGEVVIPRSAAKSEKTLKMFLDKIKLEEKLKKAGA
jgi:hypothetical protein